MMYKVFNIKKQKRDLIPIILEDSDNQIKKRIINERQYNESPRKLSPHYSENDSVFPVISELSSSMSETSSKISSTLIPSPSNECLRFDGTNKLLAVDSLSRNRCPTVERRETLIITAKAPLLRCFLRNNRRAANVVSPELISDGYYSDGYDEFRDDLSSEDDLFDHKVVFYIKMYLYLKL
eukprot:UN33103